MASAVTTHDTSGTTDLTSTYSGCTRRKFSGIGHRTQAFRSGVRCSSPVILKMVYIDPQGSMITCKGSTALFIGYKHYLDNASSIAFSQRNSSTHLIEDEIFNDRDIINNLVDYEDGYSLKANTMYAGIQLSNKSEKHFLKIDTNSERSLKFEKWLRSCTSVYLRHSQAID
ncbi:uncharacterized protein TNCV_4088371 [Trichonephila clavipes]|nr:uncharacterized protein TNCV_4088371 [Trichonephila clavipes]